MKFKIKDQTLLAEEYEKMLLNELSPSYIHDKLLVNRYDYPITKYKQKRLDRIEDKFNNRLLKGEDLFNYNVDGIDYRAVIVKYEQTEDGYGPIIGYGFVYIPKEVNEDVGVGRVHFSLDEHGKLIDVFIGQREVYFHTRADAVKFLNQIYRVGEVHHAGGFKIPGEKLRKMSVLQLPIGGLH